MNRHPLIDPAELAQRLRSPAQRTLVADCRFDLSDPAAGRRAHRAGHLPGAVYWSLDDDLCGAKTGLNGRHPLPAREAFLARVAEAGADDDTLVVVYDDQGGPYAARAWWMLRWIGHREAAVLDGGLGAWTAAGLGLETEPPAPRPPGRLTLGPALVQWVDRDGLLAALGRDERRVLDARAPDRFRGENETIDPVAGRIPGSLNRFFRDNLDASGRFKPAAQLRAEFDAVAGGVPASALVNSCGSGVTACHNLLALEIAGMQGAALYPGSWSEWSAWPDAPIARGD